MHVARKRREFESGDVRRAVEAHYDDVFAYCRRYTQTADEAQDAAQEVFLRFVRTADRYRDDGKPLAYLLTIARNVCIDAGRKRSRVCCELPGDGDLAVSDALCSSSADPCSHEGEKQEALRRALASLPFDMQEVLELRFDQELSVTEIARVLGVSRFAVKRRIDAALAALRGKMESEGKGRP